MSVVSHSHDEMHAVAGRERKDEGTGKRKRKWLESS